MFTGELTNRVLSMLRWWLDRTAYHNATRTRWNRLTTELARRRNRRPHWWNTPTIAHPQIGRAGRLTPAQAWRANGGRWTPQHSQPYQELLPAVLDAIRQLTPPTPQPQTHG